MEPVLPIGRLVDSERCAAPCGSTPTRESLPWWSQLSSPLAVPSAPATGLEPKVAVEPQHRLPADRAVVTAAGTPVVLVPNAAYRPETTPEKIELKDGALAAYLADDGDSTDSFAATDWVELRAQVERHVAEHYPLPLNQLSPNQALTIAAQITRDIEVQNQVLVQITLQAVAEAEKGAPIEPFALDYAASFDTQGVEKFFEPDNDGVCRHRTTITRAIFRVLQSLQDSNTTQLANTTVKAVHAPVDNVGHGWLACYTVQPDGAVVVTQADPTLDDIGETGVSLGVDFSLLPGYAYHWQNTLLTALGDSTGIDFRNDWYHANTWRDFSPEQVRGEALTGSQRTILSRFVAKWDHGAGWLDRARAGNDQIEEAELAERVAEFKADFMALPWQLRPDAWAALTESARDFALSKWWSASLAQAFLEMVAERRGQLRGDVTPFDVLAEEGGFARLSEVIGALALPQQVDAIAQLDPEARQSLRAYRARRGLPRLCEQPRPLHSEGDVDALRATQSQAQTD